MSRYMVAIAVMSLFLSACGKSEEPKMEEQAGADTAMQSETAGSMDSGMADETASTEAAMSEAPMEEPAAGEMEQEGMAAMESTMTEAKDQAEATMAQAEETMSEMASGMTPADSGEGKKAYGQICFACHDQGVAGAPKLGDKGAWASRIAKGNETLYTNAINGFQGEAGVMPPKGGMPSLSDDQVKAAVDYMVGQSK